MEKLLQRLNDYEMLRENIKNGDIEGVTSFVEKYPNDKVVYDASLESAVALSLKLRKLKVYELLIFKGYKLGPHEEYLPEEIFESNRSEGIEIMQKHKLILQSKCLLVPSTPPENQQEFNKKMKNALEELNGIEWIEPLLQVAACSDELTILFDFSSTTTIGIDPRKVRKVYGTTYLKHSCITIGAKCLLDDGSRLTVLGTLAHELCHFVIHLMFKNSCKPYLKNDDEMCLVYGDVVNTYEDNCEDIISRVYRNSAKFWHAELIVRVPHLFALYNGDDEKLEQCKREFKDLFDFYETYILKKIQFELPQLKEKFKIKELNDFCNFSEFGMNLEAKQIENLKLDLKSSRKVQCLVSNVVRLTMKSIHEQLKRNDKLNSNVLVEFRVLKNEKLFCKVIKALKYSVQPTLIIDCENEKVDQIEEFARKMKIDQKVIFVTKEQIKLDLIEVTEIKHSWIQLTTDTKEILLKTNVFFQGIEIRLEKLLIKNSAAMEIFPLNAFAQEKRIEIGEKIQFKDITIHIQRKFVPMDTKMIWKGKNLINDGKTVDEIIQLSQKTNVVLIADEPGSGKSTELKMITKTLKERFSSHWIVYIDLKQFTKVFQKDKKVTMSFVHETPKFLSEKILKLQSFEAEMFVELYNSDRVIVLLDGVDEISPCYEEFVLKLMMGINQQTKNKLWIATRPHLATKLESQLSTKAMKLTPFTENNKREFFEKILSDKEIRISEICKEIALFFEKLSKTTRNEDSIYNPMLMTMIAELYKDDDDFNLADLNLFSVYKKFVEKVHLRVQEKGEVVNEDKVNFELSFSFSKFYQKKAIESTLISSIDGSVKTSILQSCFKDLRDSDLSVAQKVSTGLMFDDGSGQLFFIHRTFAEFFVAEFISQRIDKISLAENKLDLVIKLWLHVMINGDGKMIRKFLDCTMIIDESKASKSSINCMSDNIGTDCHVLFRSAKDGCLNLIKFVSLVVIDDRERLLKIWLGGGKLDSSVLMRAAEAQEIDFIKELWSFAEYIFSKLQLKELLLHVNKAGQNVLNSAVDNANDDKPFKFFLDKARDLEEDITRFTSPNYPFWNLSGSNIGNILSRCKANFNKTQMSSFMNSVNQNGYTLLHYSCGFRDVESIEPVLSELSEDIKFATEILQKSTKKGNITLMIAAENQKENVFETLWRFIEGKLCLETHKQKEALRVLNKDGMNVLQFAARSENKSNFGFVFKLYEKMFEGDCLKKILEEKNKNDENVLQVAVKSGNNHETVEMIWKRMEELFDKRTLMEMLTKRTKENKNVLDFHQAFQPFLIKNIDDSMPSETFLLWLFVAEFYPIEFVQKLATKFDQNTDFFKTLFNFENIGNNKNVLQSARENKQNPEVVNFLLKRARHFFTKEEILEKLDSNLYNLLYKA